MAFSPKRVKHRKVQRGRIKGEATRCNNIDFGEYALVSLEPFLLTNRQIEAARVALNRKIKRGGKLWIRVFPDKPYSKKPAEVRMGGGKGAPEYWVAVVKPGTIIFELAGVDKNLAEQAMTLAGSKLPFKTRFAEQIQAD
ncbi:50S ribosomal protein L16 [Treponema sp. OMZ 788]|uniref:50S ribosomal protein L16 n=1 Tax=unclassified Treponema TaxID=2638727 RepID=UPI0020A393CC|nr:MULTISPECIES: 50S ribosomal protein L16 [unclassified Treponema]UTC62988.1 50S ribosomal protein L16 [Treponema sp. OMZ 787]UTC64175.1 50S ribosomal protein L16 [Treponema sp. OMZ 788]